MLHFNDLSLMGKGQGVILVSYLIAIYALSKACPVMFYALSDLVPDYILDLLTPLSFTVIFMSFSLYLCEAICTLSLFIYSAL